MDEPVGVAANAMAAPPSRAILWKGATALLVLVMIVAAVLAYRARPAAPHATRFLMPPPDNATYAAGLRPGAQAAISPDGLTLAFVVRDSAGKILLWVRRLDALAGHALPGTDNASYPFWSPDSRFIGYSTPARGVGTA